MIIKLGVGVLAGILGLVSAGVIALFQGGIATVYVKTSDLTLFVPVPMAAAELALQFAPEEELRQISEDLAPHKDLVLAALHELAECPDAVLVEVRNRDENVLVEKKGTDLIVDVDSPHEAQVHVVVPLHSIERIFETLAD